MENLFYTHNQTRANGDTCCCAQQIHGKNVRWCQPFEAFNVPYLMEFTVCFHAFSRRMDLLGFFNGVCVCVRERITNNVYLCQMA